jgi:hypothetical protein
MRDEIERVEFRICRMRTEAEERAIQEAMSRRGFVRINSETFTEDENGTWHWMDAATGIYYPIGEWTMFDIENLVMGFLIALFVIAFIAIAIVGGYAVWIA